LAATVKKVLVTEGSRVKRGQLLLLLSDEDVRAQVASADTALANALAHEERISKLTADRAATTVELESAKAQRSHAAAVMAGMRANLSHSQLRAPFDGIVSARRVHAGDFVGPGQPLLEMEGGELEIQATLSEEEARALQIGGWVPFEAKGVQGQAEITALTPGGNVLSHRRTLRATILNRPKELRSGDFIRIEIPRPAATQDIVIPTSSLVRRGDIAGVFVVEKDRAYLRWLSVGETLEQGVAIRAGLTRDEKIILDPGMLRDGSLVEVLP
jgi:RND family efflux transporter MFP subunit